MTTGSRTGSSAVAACVGDGCEPRAQAGGAAVSGEGQARLFGAATLSGVALLMTGKDRETATAAQLPALETGTNQEAGRSTKRGIRARLLNVSMSDGVKER